MACDPRGKRFATVGADGFVRLWALPSCKEIARIQLRSAGYVAFMPPGKMCLIGTERQLELWDPETGKLKPLLKYRQQPGGLGPALAVSPDGKKFAAGTFSRTESGVRVGKGQPLAPHDGPWLRVWDVGTGKKLLDLEQDDILWMAFHADGRHLLTLTATGEVVCWDLPGRRRVATWRLPGRATEAALSPAGDRLATAHMAGTVRVWRIPWEKLPKGNGEGNGVSSIYPPIK